jgi:hypothetical protein
LINTVHAPHSPAEQPFFVPVKARLSRSIRMSVMFDGTTTSSITPFTLTFILWNAIDSSEDGSPPGCHPI